MEITIFVINIFFFIFCSDLTRSLVTFIHFLFELSNAKSSLESFGKFIITKNNLS